MKQMLVTEERGARPYQIPPDKTDNKTQKNENARGSELVPETTVEPN
jgi:hypothetical protein